MARGRTDQRLTTVVGADGTNRREPDELAVEEPLEIHLDGHLVGTTMRTPGHDFELAAGFCATEGLLDGAAIRSVKYCRSAGPGAVVASAFNVVTVDTGGAAPVPTPRLAVTTSACGACGTEDLDAIRTRTTRVAPADIDPAVIVSAPAALLGTTELFAATGAVHAAAIFDRAVEALVVREDVGRHNAVDKAIGRLVLDGAVPAVGCGLAVSGRVGVEIVHKAAAAGIGVIVAKGAPTSLAVEIAGLSGLDLYGWAGSGTARRY